MATKKTRSKKTARAARAARPRLGARRQPETLRLRNLTPSFTATDLPRSIAFYRDVLGFVIGDEWRENGTLAGFTRTHQPRNGTLLLNEPVRQSTTQMSPFLSKREPNEYSW